jgi:hypothetical protein
MTNYIETYKALARAKTNDSIDIIQYAILRAMFAKDLTKEQRIARAADLVRRHFRPIENVNKLDNGHEADEAIRLYTEMVKRSKWVLNQPELTFFNTPEDRLLYKNIAVALYECFKLPSDYYTREYVYIFVRQDLSPEYQLVQAAHAAAKMGHRLGQGGIEEEQFDGLYFSVIGVEDQFALGKAMADVQSRGHTVYLFREPDIGDQPTAFASEPIRADARRGLRSYKRLVSQ